MSFYLSEFVSNKNNCVHCIMDKCSNKDHKKDENMRKITKYVNNPLMIDELKNSIEKSNICVNGFDDQNILKNGFMYTTCLFCLSKKSNGYKCKNVKECRYGTCTLENGDVLTYCYPELKNVKHRIQIGLHIDLYMNQKNQVDYIYLGSKEKKREEEVIFEKPKIISYKEIVKTQKENNNQNNSKKNIVIQKSNNIETNDDSESEQSARSVRIDDIETSNKYKDLYEELYKDYEKVVNENIQLQNIYKNSIDYKNHNIEQRIVLENISLKTHINYLQMKMKSIKNIFNEKKALLLNSLNEDIHNDFYNQMI
jgi:hypothetical protein